MANGTLLSEVLLLVRSKPVKLLCFMPASDEEQTEVDREALGQLGDLLREALDQTSRSQREVAEDARVSTRTIYQLKKEKRTAPLESIADSIARLALVLEGDERGCKEWLRAAKIREDHSEIIARVALEVRGASNIVEETRGEPPEQRLEELLSEPAVRPRIGCALYVSPPAAVGNTRIERTVGRLIDKGEGMWFALFIPYFSPSQLSKEKKEEYYSNKPNLKTIHHDVLSGILNILSSYRAYCEKEDRVQVFRPNSEIIGFQSYPYVPQQSRPFYTREYFEEGRDDTNIEARMETIQSWSYDRKERKSIWYTYGSEGKKQKQYFRDYFYDVIYSWEKNIESKNKEWYDLKDGSTWERVNLEDLI